MRRGLVVVCVAMTWSTLCATTLQVHMADPEVRIAQKIYCEVDAAESTDRLEALVDGKVVFEKAAPVSTEEIFVLNHSQQKAGQHTLVVRVLSVEGTVKANFEHTWRTLHNGIPIVGIDENNSIRVNGELFLPVYSVGAGGRTDKWVEYGLANTGTGADFVQGEVYTKENFALWLEELVGLGVRNIGPTTRWSGIQNTHGLDSDLEQMKTYVQSLKDHPGVLMWQWADEPDGGGSASAPPDQVRSWTDTCHALDTNHPHAVNLTAYGWARDRTWDLNQCAKYSYKGLHKVLSDVVGFDFYPIEYATKTPGGLVIDFETMAKALDRIKEYNRDLIPVFSWNENCDMHGPLPPDPEDPEAKIFADGPEPKYLWTPAPTPEEMWAEYWIKVIHGVKGFKVHSAFGPGCVGFDKETNNQPPQNYEMMAKFLLWINDLRAGLLGADYSGPAITHKTLSGGRVDVLAKQSLDTLFLVSGNLRRDSQRVRFTVPALVTGKIVTVYGEDRTIVAENESFEDDFGPLGIHIYMIEQKAPLAPGGNESRGGGGCHTRSMDLGTAFCLISLFLAGLLCRKRRFV